MKGTTVGHPDPVRVQIATTQRVVEVGLRTILESAPVPMTLTVTTSLDGPEPDVVLFDVILMREGDTHDLDTWLKDTGATVIAINRTLRPELGAQARARGVEWSIDLGICDADLIQVIQEAAAGTLEESSVAEEWNPNSHLGAAAGLTRRESTVLQLIVRGLSNQQIAQNLHLSMNTVKSYIRSGYRKINVTSRSQAVSWGIQHGFATQPPESGPVR